MNYYERHLGDYAKDTAHLSMLEHGAYTLLLDRYYATENGLPEGEVYRVARARGRHERQAVDTVLREFFTCRDGLWRKNRVEQEILSAKLRIAASRENGKHGGRPKRQQNQGTEEPGGLSAGSESETHEKPAGFSLGSKTETKTKALQTPISNLQSPISSRREEEKARATRLPTDWTLTEGRRAIAESEHLDPERTFSKFTNHWKAASGANARKRDWDAAWRNWCMNDADRKPMNGSGNGSKSLAVKFQKSPGELESEAIENGISAGKSDREILAEIKSEFVSIEDIRRKREEMQHAQH